MRAKFIVLEGIDGAGTTTQTKRIAAWMEEQKLLHHVTREPSDGMIGKVIRTYLTHGDTAVSSVGNRTLALLFAADRLEHLRMEINPMLEKGAHVISDRYVMSSLVYQALDLPIQEVAGYNAHARVPDLTILLDVSVDDAERRRHLRGGAAELFDARALQLRIAEGYRFGNYKPSPPTVAAIQAVLVSTK